MNNLQSHDTLKRQIMRSVIIRFIFIRNMILIFIAGSFAGAANASGTADNVPIVFSGTINIRDSGPYKNASFPSISCDILLVGTTNGRGSPISISSSFVKGGDQCRFYQSPDNQFQSSTVSWTQGTNTPNVIKFSNLVISLANAYCDGDLKANWDLSSRITIYPTNFGTCNVDGVLNIISNPEINYTIK
ncbi:hypothetical protein [Burkholderia alba]|uniref:hypothetical protein n=1 Tax=Burkholderia alba TaxID=2683677 RepID=UPI002B0570F8|nr:hypothetical protein [Burkholderia alba]